MNVLNDELFIFRYLAALPWTYVTCTPLFYQGPIAGSEFVTYDADKLYVAQRLACVQSSGGSTTHPSLTLYDENNAVSFYLKLVAMTYDSAVPALNYTGNTVDIEDIYFSKVYQGGVNYMRFYGWRLNK